MAGVSDKELSFGWLKVRPKWMQFLNTPKWFLFFLCQYFFTQSIIVNGVFPGSLSTIEKRFGYSSYLTGMLTSSYDIAALLLTPLISYIGGSRKKPVFCGCGVFTMGVGFFIFMLPHFITPPYEPDHLSTFDNASAVVSRRMELCLANRTELGAKVDCQKETSGGYMSSYALFVLAMVVAGAGCTPMYALGVPYMDENVKAKVSPMYVGIFLASGIIGSMVGFVVISRFLSIFVELGVQTSLTILDKRWVGNWWLAFAIFGALCVFWSIWLLGFPKEFPLTKKLWERTSAGPIAKDEDALLVALKKLPKATKLVFSSLPFIFITIGVCFDFFVLAFTTVFQPKVVEVLFYLPPGKAALLYGVAAGLSALLGNLAGAYINRRLKLRMTYCARMCFIISFINVVSTGILYIKCETPSIAGVNRPYQDNPGHIQLSSPCNQACNCTGVDYAPVCGGQLSYFSPCHAGCSNLKKTTKDGRSTYSKCTCVQHNGEDPEDATKGTCMVDHVCGLKFTIFLALYSLSVFLLFFNVTPGITVTLRSVPASQESYALGHQMNLTRLLGAIPGPIVVGALLDKTCILWSSKCSEKGYCLEYDHSGMAQVMFGASLICRMISLVCYGLCWLFCRRLEEKEKIAGARGVSDNNCSETCDTGKMHSTSKI